ncbi:MAG: LacI family DNA-binding transcriptional regulator [Marmoricola sp.]
MKDVARAAGVSQAAVSYAYSRPSKLSDSQVKHIMATASRLGYAGPNIIGASLRSGKVGAIGVMVMDTLQYAFTDESTKSLLQGVVGSNRVDDVALTLLPLPHHIEALEGGSSRAHNRTALRGLVDGVIVHSLPDDHPALMYIRARQIPIVVVDAPRLPGVPLIGIRDREAARAQMHHLLELGHRHIGVVADRLRPDGHRGWVDTDRRRESTERVVRERLLGYAEECEAYGLDFDEVPVVEAGAWDDASAESAARTMLERDGLTAIAATSDTMAFGVLKVAAELGIDVPADLSVIGFDDVPIAEAAGLTTIRQPMVEKGRIAANMLMDMIAGRLDREEQQTLPTELIIRNTTARLA